jgi:hypothetical protein
LKHKVFHCFVHPWPTDRAPETRAVELAGHQRTEPAENGVGLSGDCNLRRSFATETVGDLGQCGFLALREADL